MIQEPETLYKLMTLYLLDKVSLPLTNNQLSEFFLGKKYTTYMTLQIILNDLTESGLIEARKVVNATHYEINDDGREALRFFIGDISSAAIADMDAFLEANKFSIRSEVDNTADYYRAGSGNFIVRCISKEGRNTLINIELSVPDEQIAIDMCANWSSHCQELYSHIMLALMSSGTGKA